ncbi:medial glomeruli [Carabus blaptoides fortunei]
MQKNSKFFICAAGIFVCYFYFGILQEKITRGKYGTDVKNEEGVVVSSSEKYSYMFALVFVQCVVNYIFAKGMLTVWPKGEDKTPTIYLSSSALTYLLAMVCSNMALLWVPYPTQVVGKSAKPIPVLILGVLVGHKSYPMKKYFFVFLIVIGVILFMYKDRPISSQGDSSFGLGEILLLLSLTMDGLTGAVQERMRAEASPSAQHMMLGMNFWSSLFVGFVLIISGEGVEFVQFVSRHPVALVHIAALAIAGALGQLFIFLTVSEYGPLPCSVITTTRKFFTVLGSVLLFGNSLSSRQWLGAVIVFSGLFLDAYYSKSQPKKK